MGDGLEAEVNLWLVCLLEEEKGGGLWVSQVSSLGEEEC